MFLTTMAKLYIKVIVPKTQVKSWYHMILQFIQSVNL